ncbi:MAG: hypothetical protein WED07_07380 [Candidatus Freyarchaeum deiterrae]
MPKKELETKDKKYDYEENFQQRRFETILEWTGWGSLVTLIVVFAAVILLSDVTIDYQTSAMMIMAIYFWGVSWATGKLIKDTPQAWKHYFHWWTVAIVLGGILLALGVAFVPT